MSLIARSRRLYHYTSADHAVSNIRRKRLKVAEFHDLNDPYELLGVDLSDEQNRRAFEMLKEQQRSSRGLLCLSESGNHLLMWSHYGDRHRGMCLAFSCSSESFCPVQYSNCRLPFPTDSETLNEEFMRAVLFTKAAAWSYEREWRAYVALDDDEWVAAAKRRMYFKEFAPDLVLEEVILGMACDVKKREVESLFQGYGVAPVVKRSRMADRTFGLLLYS